MTMLAPSPDEGPNTTPTTERECLAPMSDATDQTLTDPASETPVDPPKAGAPARGNPTPTESTDEDDSGGHSAMSGAPEEGAEDAEPHLSVTQRVRQTLARAEVMAADWGLDVRPPSFTREGLPPLNASRAYARRGAQAPVTGPTRVGARLWDALTRWLRWTLRLADHQLARPGRALVALLVVALLVRIPHVRTALEIAASLIDIITFYTGLQWLLGLV